MITDVQKIKSIVEDSKSFALLLGDNFEEHELLAREALKIALHLKGLSPYLLPEVPKSFKEEWLPVLSSVKCGEATHSVSIHIPKNLSTVQEISYEDGGDVFTLNIASDKKFLEKEDLIFEEKPLVIDGVFSFNQPDVADLSKFNAQISIPSKEKTIFINQNGKTLAEAVYDIIHAIDSKLLNQENIHTTLLASLLLETDCFHCNPSGSALTAGGLLLDIGADQKLVTEIMQNKNTHNFAQILGRALARTRINENLKSLWTFIPKQDLEKTGCSSNSLLFFYKIGQKIKGLMPKQEHSLVFWQDDGGVNGMVFFNDDSDENGEKINFLLEKLNGKLQGNFISAGPFANFSEAEIKFQQALKEVIK
jgi:hypothetical protein